MSENNGTFDLSGVFQVQQNYLTDLSNSYPNVNNGPVIAKYMLDLQNKVGDVTQSYKDANTSADNVLTEQNQMIDIVETEQKRLEKKKLLIDQAEMEEKRKVMLTNSNRLRNAEYTKIILVLIIGVVIHILLIVGYKYFFSESESDNIFTVFALIHIGNFTMWTIMAFYLYINIQSRSQINFNQLDLPPPDTSGTASTPAVANYDNLFADLGMCVANSCCGPKTKYDSTLKKCVEVDYNPNLIPDTTPASSSPTKEGFDAQKGITSLTVSPQFIEGTTTKGWKSHSTFGHPIPRESTHEDEVKEFDPLNATEDELRQKTRDNVNGNMGNIMGSLSGMAAEPQLPNMNDIMSNMNDPSALLGKAPDLYSKCGFTTMELEMKNNPIYAHHNNSFLPKKFTLEDDNTISQGIEKRMTKYI
jgi:hypothetical protein